MVKTLVTRQSLAQFKRDLRQYAKSAGKTNRDVAIGMAKITAKSLATKTQPFGLTADKGEKFKLSIAIQILRAMAEHPGEIRDPRKIHNFARRRGVVPRRRFPEQHHEWTPQENAIVESYLQRQMKKAGQIKGAWIAAGESLGGRKIRGVPKWVRAHVKKGTSSVTGSTGKASVLLHNNISYLTDRLCDQNAAFVDSIRRYGELMYYAKALKKDKTI